ncbi:MAG: hypothetical protein R2834_18445 [Rhodothermales bacterium]
MSSSKKKTLKTDLSGQLAWNLATELRKELLESQKLRAQIIVAKVTFVSTAVGVLVANIDKVPPSVLVVPAFAAIFLDFLTASYSFSIKRIGFYIRYHLEPVIREQCLWPDKALLWEEFMDTPKARQRLSITGNLGITTIATGLGVLGVVIPWQPQLSVWMQVAVVGSLVLFFVLATRAYIQPWKFGKAD